jgi:hypothetical protein
VNNKIVKFFKLSLEKWSTQLQLKTNKELTQSTPIKINRRIFQDASVSPLIFCTAQVYGTERKINHLLCVDDLNGIEERKN